jgi:hypothetical protein
LDRHNTYKFIEAREPPGSDFSRVRSEEGHLVLILVDNGDFDVDMMFLALVRDQGLGFAIKATASPVEELTCYGKVIFLRSHADNNL